MQAGSFAPTPRLYDKIHSMSGNNSGWNRPASNQPTAGRSAKSGVRSAKKVLCALCLVLCAALGICVWLFSGGDDKPAPSAQHQAPSTIKEVAPAAAPVYKEEPKVDDEAAKRKARAEKLKKMTPDERWEFLLEEAKKKPLDLTPTTNQTFKTGTEQVMSWIFTTKLGNLPPPLPQTSLFDIAHLAEILIADNPILETDNEKQREAKEIVMEAKKELREYIKQGGDIDQFLEYYRGQLVQAHSEWQESQKSVMKVIREDPDIAGEYIREVNERLAKKGIKPVMIPPPLAEKAGIDLEAIKPTSKPSME